MPMKYFTQLYNPSERTLELLRQIARSYRVLKLADGTTMSLCLN